MAKKKTALETGTIIHKSQGQEAWDRLKKRKGAMISLAGIILLLLIAIFADVIADYDTECVMQNVQMKFQGPSLEHIFGMDQVGRDLFARVVHGTRTALIMGVGATSISLIIGAVLACSCAFFGGKVDMIIMRCLDVLSSIPALVLAMAICAGIGNGMWQLITALSIGGISGFTRMFRSKALIIANMEYMEAGKALGASTPWLMTKYLFPNIISVVLVQGSMMVSSNVLMGATLSFIGLGVQPPQPEWGSMLSEALTYFQLYHRVDIVTGVFLILTSLCINTFGDCLRDALDPQLKGRA